MSSGAIQYGVPTTDVRLAASVVRLMANPKSAILTLPVHMGKHTGFQTEVLKADGGGAASGLDGQERRGPERERSHATRKYTTLLVDEDVVRLYVAMQPVLLVHRLGGGGGNGHGEGQRGRGRRRAERMRVYSCEVCRGGKGRWEGGQSVCVCGVVCGCVFVCVCVCGCGCVCGCVYVVVCVCRFVCLTLSPLRISLHT